jgi:hypothetical protein
MIRGFYIVFAWSMTGSWRRSLKPRLCDEPATQTLTQSNSRTKFLCFASLYV